MTQSTFQRRAAVGAAIAAGSLLASPDAAWAGQHNVQTVVNGAHVLRARGYEEEVGNNLEHWFDIRSAESAPFLDTVCNTQAWMGELHPPDQRLVFAESTSRNSNCSFLLKYYDWPGWDSNYPEDVRIRAKWRSDATPGGDWIRIGDLRD